MFSASLKIYRSLRGRPSQNRLQCPLAEAVSIRQSRQFEALAFSVYAVEHLGLHQAFGRQHSGSRPKSRSSRFANRLFIADRPKSGALPNIIQQRTNKMFPKQNCEKN